MYLIMSAKDIMSNLFKLTELHIITLEEFTLYWFFWLHRGEPVTHKGVAAVIGRKDPKTARKYTHALVELGLVRFEVVRARGVRGIRPIPMKIDAACMARLVGPVRKVIRKKRTGGAAKNKKYIPLAKLLYDTHKRHDEKFLAGKDLSVTFDRWAGDIRLLVEKDERDYVLVEKIIKWCQGDGNFWSPNILSGRTLRDKFNVLYGQYKRDGGKGGCVKHHKKISGKKFEGADVKGLLNGL